MHGLAGSAAVALLVMSTIHNHFWSAIYLGVFGLGTIAGMMLISIGMAVPVAISPVPTENSESGKKSRVLGSLYIVLPHAQACALHRGRYRPPVPQSGRS